MWDSARKAKCSPGMHCSSVWEQECTIARVSQDRTGEYETLHTERANEHMSRQPNTSCACLVSPKNVNTYRPMRKIVKQNNCLYKLSHLKYSFRATGLLLPAYCSFTHFMGTQIGLETQHCLLIADTETNRNQVLQKRSWVSFNT